MLNSGIDVRPALRKLTYGVALSALLVAGRVRAEEKSESKTELTPVPLIGGNTDMGVAVGFLASLARTHPYYHPYRYRIELAAMVTFKSEEGKLENPFQDHYLLVSLPNVIRNRLQLEFRASFTRESTLKYYGLGNASQVPASLSLDDKSFEYDRVHPTLRVRAIERLTRIMQLELGISYTQNWIHVPEQTRLIQDLRSTDARVRDLVSPVKDHGVLVFSYGVALDTRNDTVNPVTGMYHALRLDLSPGNDSTLPYRYARANGSFRWFAGLGLGDATLALRVVGDSLVGHPPVYELSRVDDTSALGGPNGVRGVPGDRYAGKLKLFGNLELRTTVTHFNLLGKRNGLGIAAFYDAGRLWADYRRQPELDGTTLGLKYGIGGGLRVIAGTSFVLRADVAWSPDARPIGAYIASGQVF